MKPIEILIVDDSKALRMYLSEILKELDTRITETSNGVEAFNLIQKNKFDIIFMDINLPGKSGIDVIKKVRNSLNIKALPIIVITELERDELIKEAFEVGANDFIRKPLNPVEVIARLKVRFDNYELLHKLKMANDEIRKLKDQKKKNIYRATVTSAQHILNNLLQQVNIVNKEIARNSTFNQEVANKFIVMQKQASELVHKLSSIEKIDVSEIKKSVYPQ